MVIRRCNFEDAAELVAVRHVQLAGYEVEAALIGSREIPGLSETVEQLAASREEFWGAFDGSRPAGVIAVEAIATDGGDGARVCISRLAVDPAFFRRGVGRGLVRHIVDEFGRRQGRVVSVSTGAANGPGRALYASEGFRLIGEREVGREQRVRVVEYRWG